jgi:hypothetical protein
MALGERRVTHEGVVPAFNLKMRFIKDEGTPNLMSGEGSQRGY